MNSTSTSGEKSHSSRATSKVVRRMDRPTDRPTPDLYDSEEIPVLIRLPDVRRSAAAIATVEASATRKHAESSAPMASSAAGEETSRRRHRSRHGAQRDSQARSATAPWVSTNWSSIASKLFVIIMLAVITGLVFVLLQGGTRTVEKDPPSTWSASGDKSAETAEPNARTASAAIRATSRPCSTPGSCTTRA